MSGVFLLASLYATLFNTIFTPLNSQIAKLFGYLAIVCFWLYSVVTFFEAKKTNKTTLALLFFIGISLIANISNNSVSSVRSLVIAIVSFICFYNVVGISHKTEKPVSFKQITIITTILALWFLFITIGDFSFIYKTFNTVDIITLGMENPNAAGAYALFAMLILCLNIPRAKKLLSKAWFILLTAGMIYVIVVLESRMIMLCALIFVLLFVVKLYKKVGSLVSFIVLISPILMFALHIILDQKLSDYIFMGEKFDTGRVQMYTEFLADLSKRPASVLFGDIFLYPFINLHNGALSIVGGIGLVGLVCVYICWWQKLRYLIKNKRNDFQSLSFVALLCMFFNSAMEAMTVVGLVPFSIFVIVLIELAEGNIE